jgi:mRNA interferase RelE/StbE
VLLLSLSPSALKFLETLPPKQYRQVVRTFFALLRTPEPHDSAALKGFPYRRVDIGEYRIVYRVEGPTLRVPLIDKRNDDAIYQAVRRLPS